ncbi:MAG: type II toxin-antitoxin system VapC family toxin [Acidimicrobiia bacterium]
MARARASQEAYWAAPDLVDVETVAVLRKRWRAGDLTARRFKAAVDDLLALPMARFPTGPSMARAYELRANVTPYDAAYVALAETLSYPLVTADVRLSRAPGLRCQIEVLSI